MYYINMAMYNKKYFTAPDRSTNIQFRLEAEILGHHMPFP